MSGKVGKGAEKVDLKAPCQVISDRFIICDSKVFIGCRVRSRDHLHNLFSVPVDANLIEFLQL